MRKKNAFLTVLLFVIISLFLTGCGNKTALTSDQFMSIAKENNYTVSDLTSQYEILSNVNSVTIAQSGNDYQVEFYVLSNVTSAEKMYETNKSTFENYKSNTSAESSLSNNNYSTYSLTSDGYYMYLSRIDNTLLYLRVKNTYKDTVKEFIKGLGY